MRTGQLLEKRRADWDELEQLCSHFQEGKRATIRNGPSVARLAMLYRSACSDLAMAEFYQIPPVTVDYLHGLVARAHNQLYRSRQFDWGQWWNVVSVDVPRAIFSDGCVHVAAILFFGLFAISAVLSQSEPEFPKYATRVVGTEGLEQVEEMYEKPLEGNFDQYIGAAPLRERIGGD